MWKRLLLVILIVSLSAMMVAYWVRMASISERPVPMPRMAAIMGVPAAQSTVRQPQPLTPAQLFRVAEFYHHGRPGVVPNLEKSLSFYTRALHAYRNDPIQEGRVHMAVSKLYRDGIGNTIPDARAAVHHLLDAARCGYESALLEIADLYMNGLHPFYLPEKPLASMLYDLIKRNEQISKPVRMICTQKTREIMRVEYNDMDAFMEPGREYIPLPKNILNDIQSIMLQRSSFIAASIPQSLIAQMEEVDRQHQRQQQKDTPVINLEDFDVRMQEAIWNDLVARHQPVHQTHVMSDSQNVHSTSVQNAAVKNMQAIERETSIDHRGDNHIQDFMQHLEASGKFSQESIAKIRDVMQSLKGWQHSRYNRSEKDVFNLVWSRINDTINKDRRDDMIYVLAQNIESAHEHGHVVCSTGKIVRMLGSLEGMDAKSDQMQALKPEWAIDEEIGTLAAKVRTEVLSASTDSERTAYEKAHPEETLSAKMKDALIAKCKSQYVEAGILDQSMLDAKLETYLSAF